MTEHRYWLFKSEPSSYSFSDLMGEEDQTAEWDGVRNYQARNFLRDEVKVGDGVLLLPLQRKAAGGRGYGGSSARMGTRTTRPGTPTRNTPTRRARRRSQSGSWWTSRARRRWRKR